MTCPRMNKFFTQEQKARIVKCSPGRYGDYDALQSTQFIKPSFADLAYVI